MDSSRGEGTGDMGVKKKPRKKAAGAAGEAAGGARQARGDGDQGAGTALPERLEEHRTRVRCDFEAPKQTHSTQYTGAYSAVGADVGLTLEQFRRDFRVEIKSVVGNDLVFDLVGVDPAIANAFRRILISEVPTMAIEKVFIADNTSLVQDEVLSHRLGLVPLQVDPRLFDYLPQDGLANESNTIVFRLSHKCTQGKGPNALPEGTKVLSNMLTWMPGGSQYPPDQPKKKFTTFSKSQDMLHNFAANPPCPTYPDILLAKLRPGQAIELEAHAVKGIGKTHAKWSPVATASYRMLPEVVLKKAVEDDEAVELVRKCPMRVFDIEDFGGTKRATVARPRDCTLCRECVRGEEWSERVQLNRVRNHFIFSVEGTGSLPPNVLFTEAVGILRDKASRIAAELS